MSKTTTPKFTTAEARADAIKSAEYYLEEAIKKASSKATKAVMAQNESIAADKHVAKCREELAALKRSRVSTKKGDQ